MAGHLTTHVLDTAQGCPAANLVIELWRINVSSGERTLLKTVRTNPNGRTDFPLLENDAFSIGVYELVFDVGAYFSEQHQAHGVTPFLGLVPVRFGIADNSAHYHVPLLVSPWSYSTYRGS